MKSSTYWKFGAISLVAVLTCILYNPFQLYFLNDDFIAVSQSPLLHYVYGTTFRPLADLTLLGDDLLFGMHAWGYHLTNLIFHLLAAALVYQLTRELIRQFSIPHNSNLALISTLIFLLYAFHSEAVLWIIGRGGSLVTIFSVASLLFYLKKAQRPYYFAFSILFFIAGLFTYEASWVLPLLVTVWVFCQGSLPPKISKSERNHLAVYWLVFLVFLLVRKQIVGDLIGSPYLGGDFLRMPARFYLYNFTALIARSFLPPVENSTYFVWMSGLLAVLLLTVFIFLLKKKQLSRFRVFIWISFFLCLSPFVLLGINTHNSEGERFLYLPSVFLCIALADLITLLPGRLRGGILLGYLVFHSYFLFSSAQAFRQSSLIVSKTMHTLEKSHFSLNRLYLIDLPSQYKGGFIFRKAFGNALHWMAGGIRANQTIEVSKSVIHKRVVPYSTRLIPYETMDHSLYLTTVDQLKKKGLLFEKGDAIFYWTDSSFYIISY